MRSKEQIARIGAIGAVFAASFLTPSSSEFRPSTRAEQQYSITIEGLDLQTAQLARRAAMNWDEHYKCGRSIKIIPFKGESQKKGKGTITIVGEEDPGLIRLGEATDVEFEILHAMSHACQPDKPTLLEKPLPYVDGIIRGFHGLNIMVTTKYGEETNFTLFEEGMAERNASYFSGYTVSDPRYFAIGNLTRTRIPLDKYPNAHKWNQVNNVPLFLQVVLNLPPGMFITAAHIQDAMLVYQNVWNQAENSMR